MANMINTTYFPQFRNAGTVGKGATTSTKTSAKNVAAQYGANTTVELSGAGKNALAKLQSDAVDEYDVNGFAAETDAADATDESKLSAKAKSFLEGLRQKYGDYNFVVSNDLDTSQTLGSDKPYSVLLTNEELEKMADDEEYANKVMGNVGKAVDTLKDLSEKDLGEGVEFSQLSISIDDEGNMKLFAQLEKMTADQQERLEAAKEKRAEEKKEAAQKAEDAAKEDADAEPPEWSRILFKGADVEADSAEELLAKIFQIDWNKIDEEEAFI